MSNSHFPKTFSQSLQAKNVTSDNFEKSVQSSVRSNRPEKENSSIDDSTSTILAQPSVEWPISQPDDSDSEFVEQLSGSVKRKRSEEFIQGPTNIEAKNRKIAGSTKKTKTCDCDAIIDHLRETIINESTQKLELARDVNTKLEQTHKLLLLVNDILGVCQSGIAEVNSLVPGNLYFATSLSRCEYDVEAAKVHYAYMRRINDQDLLTKKNLALNNTLGSVIDKCNTTHDIIKRDVTPPSTQSTQARQSKPTAKVEADKKYLKFKKVQFSTPIKPSKIALSPSSSPIESNIEVPIPANIAATEQYVFANQEHATAHMKSNLSKFKKDSANKAGNKIDFTTFNISQEDVENSTIRPSRSTAPFVNFRMAVPKRSAPTTDSLKVETSQKNSESSKLSNEIDFDTWDFEKAAEEHEERFLARTIKKEAKKCFAKKRWTMNK